MGVSNCNKLSSWGDFGDLDRHSCEGRNPENPLPAELDARLREHDKKYTQPLNKSK